MPLFFFHLRTARDLDRDDVGTTFPDLDAAYLDVCRAIPDMVDGLFRAGHDPLRCAFEIADERGRPLMEVPFAERLTRPTLCAPVRAPRRTASAPDPGGPAGDLLGRAAAAAAEAQALRRRLRDTVATFERTALRPDASFINIIARVYALPGGVGGDEAAPSTRALPIPGGAGRGSAR